MSDNSSADKPVSTNQIEVWKSIQGWDNGYECSSFGRIRVVDRISFKGSRLKGRMINHYINQYGYPYTTLRRGGVRVTQRVHRLVAIEFISNPENKPCVNHRDGDKTNNNINNLEWVTHSENSQHALDTGLSKNKGVTHCRAVLTPALIHWARTLRELGYTIKSIGLLIGIKRETLGAALIRRNWKNLQ